MLLINVCLQKLRHLPPRPTASAYPYCPILAMQMIACMSSNKNKEIALALNEIPSRNFPKSTLSLEAAPLALSEP